MPRQVRRETTNGNGLRQLLDLEAELGRQLERARREAEEMRTRSDQTAAALRQYGEAEIAADEEALGRRVKEWLDRESRIIRDDLSRRKKALESIPAPRLDAIARELLAHISAPNRGTP